jgi:hypothetical protein
MITQVTKKTPLRGIVSQAVSKIAAAAKVLSEGSHLYRRAETAKRYFAMSDDELTERGLRRDEIMRRVFGAQLYL